MDGAENGPEKKCVSVERGLCTEKVRISTEIIIPALSARRDVSRYLIKRAVWTLRIIFIFSVPLVYRLIIGMIWYNIAADIVLLRPK